MIDSPWEAEFSPEEEPNRTLCLEGVSVGVCAGAAGVSFAGAATAGTVPGAAEVFASADLSEALAGLWENDEVAPTTEPKSERCLTGVSSAAAPGRSAKADLTLRDLSKTTA